jgi:hypothetical protein
MSMHPLKEPTMSSTSHNSENCGAVLSGRRVRRADRPVPVGHTASEPDVQTSSGAQIRLLRDGDVIRAIEVTCTCGERIVLDCIY